MQPVQQRQWQRRVCIGPVRRRLVARSGGVGCLALVMACGILAGCEDTPSSYGRVCDRADHPSSAVQKPEFVRNLSIGNTGWFSSPAAFDLDGDGRKEIIAP